MTELVRIDWRRRLLALSAVTTAVVLAAICGCRPQQDPTPATPVSVKRSSVRVLVLDDPALAGAIQREWSARTNIEIDVTEKTGEQIGRAERLSTDVVIYPSRLLGELAEKRLITALPDSVSHHEQFARLDIFNLIRLREMRWGAKLYAVSFGSPQLTLYYRADLLKHLGRQPPRTWQEYQELVQLLADRERLGDLAPAAAQPWYSTIEPLGAGWAGQVLLARAAAYARHPAHFSTLFNLRSMDPLVDGPPFVRALEELAAAYRASSSKSTELTPQDARRLLREGKCGLALSWPSRASQDSNSSTKTDGLTGFAELPGSREVYNFETGKWDPRGESETLPVPLLAVAGRLGSISSQCRRTSAALHVLVWLTGEKWSSDVAPHSLATTLYRQSHLAAPQLWVEGRVTPQAAQQYANLVQTTQNRTECVVSLRIPGTNKHFSALDDDYLAALDDAVHEAVLGGKTPQDALKTAAARWRAITEKLGIDAQRRAYHRSLGLAAP